MKQDIIAKLKAEKINVRLVRHRQAVVELEDGGRYALRVSRRIETRRTYRAKKTDEEKAYTYGYFVLNMTNLPDDVDGALVVFLGKKDRIEKVATVSKFVNIIKRTMLTRDALDGYAESVLFDIDGVTWGQQA